MKFKLHARTMLRYLKYRKTVYSSVWFSHDLWVLNLSNVLLLWEKHCRPDISKLYWKHHRYILLYDVLFYRIARNDIASTSHHDMIDTHVDGINFKIPFSPKVTSEIRSNSCQELFFVKTAKMKRRSSFRRSSIQTTELLARKDTAISFTDPSPLPGQQERYGKTFSNHISKPRVVPWRKVDDRPCLQSSPLPGANVHLLRSPCYVKAILEGFPATYRSPIRPTDKKSTFEMILSTCDISFINKIGRSCWNGRLEKCFCLDSIRKRAPPTRLKTSMKTAFGRTGHWRAWIYPNSRHHVWGFDTCTIDGTSKVRDSKL